VSEGVCLSYRFADRDRFANEETSKSSILIRAVFSSGRASLLRKRTSFPLIVPLIVPGPFAQTRVRDEFWKGGHAERTLLAHLSSPLMTARPRDGACTSERIGKRRLACSPLSHPFVSGIDLLAVIARHRPFGPIESTDSEMTRILPLARRLDRRPMPPRVSFAASSPRCIIYQRHDGTDLPRAPASSSRGGSCNPSAGRPTIIYRST